MPHRSRTFTPAVLSLAVMLSACDGRVRSPTAPGVPPAPAPTTAGGPFTLSGIVFEVTANGQAPIEGVQVYCDSCGSPVGHTFVDTDSNGFYSFSWTNNGANPLFVTKAGYEIVDPTGAVRDAYGRVKVNVDGDTRFDVELVRR